MEHDQKQAKEAFQWFASLLGDQDLAQALEDGRTFSWVPKADITTYELALSMNLVPLILTSEKWQYHAKIYDMLPPGAQRHFKVGSLEEDG